MTRALRGLAALTLLAVAPLAAQHGPVADRLLGLQGKERPDEGSACRLAGGGPNVTGASTRFQSALTNNVDQNKRRLLTEGRDLTLQAIQGGQAGSSKAWYYLARIYLQQGDLVGADTAFTHLVAIAPTCAAEASVYRLRAWSNLMSAAGTHRTAERTDSAVYLARQANLIESSRPQSWYTIGAAFLDQQQNDSAVSYLLRAYAAPSDSSANAVAIRQASAYQVAVIEYNKRDFAAAVRYFAEAVRLKPDDTDAKRNLAASLRQAGMADSAAKVEQGMMSAAAGSEGGLTVAQLFDIGVAQFNQRDYTGAAATFEKIVAVEPYNRDALFNMAQAYNGANNSDKLLETALRLRAVDALSFEALQLVGAGYRAKNDRAKVLETATALGGATVDVRINGFNTTATGATLTLRATGRDGRDINDRAIRAVPIPIIVEFLDKDGTVVGTSEAVVPALAANAFQDLTVAGTGAGIVAWRYRRK